MFNKLWTLYQKQNRRETIELGELFIRTLNEKIMSEYTVVKKTVENEFAMIA